MGILHRSAAARDVPFRYKKSAAMLRLHPRRAIHGAKAISLLGCLLVGACGDRTGLVVPPQANAGDICVPVLASAYDQSCAIDEDCILVSEVPECPADRCDRCSPAAIRKSEASDYQGALARALAGTPSGFPCGCDAGNLARCIDAKCQAQPPPFAVAPASDTLPACANVGGQCVYSVMGACPGKTSRGPAYSCLWSNEVCCLNR
jgi:hypothetical protein